MMLFRLLLANTFSRLGPATRFVHLRSSLFRWAGADIANQVRCAQGVWLANVNVSIGEGTWIGTGTKIIPGIDARIAIGECCDLGPECLIVSGSHEIGGSDRRAGLGSSSPIRIGRGTWLGARATVLAGVEIGPGCVVPAGSVVTRSVGGDLLVAGVPAVAKRAL